MTHNAETARKRATHNWIVGGLALCVFGFFNLYLRFEQEQPGLRRKEFLATEEVSSQLRDFGELLRWHVAANEGQLPGPDVDLNPWIAKTDLSPDILSKCTYYTGFQWNDNPSTVILATNETFDLNGAPSRMISTLDGGQSFIPDSALSALIAEQNQPEWLAYREGTADRAWRFLELLPQLETKNTKPASINIAKTIEVLNSGSDHERGNAADALSEIPNPSPRVVNLLFEALSDSKTAYHAAQRLAVLSLQDDTIVPRLIEQLKSGNHTAKGWTMVALQQISLQNAPEAIPVLLEMWPTIPKGISSKPKTIATAGPLADEAVPLLIELLPTDSWDAKCAAIALGRIGPAAKDAIPALREQMQRGDHYPMDMATALWRIDPSTAPEVLAFVLGQPKDEYIQLYAILHKDLNAIDLLGEMGPDAREAIPMLEANLYGDMGIDAAWALWRIDPTLKTDVSPILLEFMRIDVPSEDRIAKLSRTSAAKPQWAHHFSYRFPAAGVLWQMYPEKRDSLVPVFIALLQEWQNDKVLKKLNYEARAALPALQHIVSLNISPEITLLAREAIQEIETTAIGRW